MTVGDVVVVALISNAVNVTITSITGAGTGWTNAACHAFQSGVDNIDIEYTLAATTAFQQPVANFSGTVTGAYLEEMELRPPAGHSAIFDGCAHNTPTTSATATGGAPTVTGTDAIVQFYGGLNTTPNAFNSWSGSYVATLEGTGLWLNGNSGTAPTVGLAASASMNIDAIAFKTDAGAFTPPTATFNIANYAIPTISAGKTCTAGACPGLTVGSTTAGDALYLVEFDATAPNTISSISGGCASWVIPAGLHKTGATGGWELNHAYCLSATGGVTTITPTMSGTLTGFFSVWQFHRTSGSWTLDVDGCTLNGGSATFMPAGQPLTLSNNNPHVTIQSIVASGGVDGATFYPFPFATGVPNGTAISNNNVTGANAVLLNDTVGQTPVWPFPGATTGTSTAVCGASFQ